MGNNENVITCPYCDQKIHIVKKSQAIQCEYCGAKITSTGETYKESSKAFSIVSLINGIIALLTSWFFVGIINAVVGIVFGIIGISKKKLKGCAIAGLITSIIAILLGVLFGYIVFFAPDYSSTSTDKQSQEQYQEENSADLTANDLVIAQVEVSHNDTIPELDQVEVDETESQPVTQNIINDSEEIISQTEDVTEPSTDDINIEKLEEQTSYQEEVQDTTSTNDFDPETETNTTDNSSETVEKSEYYVQLNFNYEKSTGLNYKYDVKIYIDGEYVADLYYNSSKTIEAYLSPGKHSIYVKRINHSGKSKKIKFKVTEDTYKNIKVYENSISGITCKFDD